MWSIHELRRIANSMQRALKNQINIESMIRNIENIADELREYNYNCQCSSAIPCKYWRAGCCIFGIRCRYKHLKINISPLDCPYGIRCKQKINGKCNCVSNIRNKNNRLYLQKPSIGKSNGNNKNLNNQHSINNLDNCNRKIITFQNNGIKKTVMTTIAKIDVPQCNSNNSDRLEFVKSNNIVSDNQSDIKEEEKTNFENNNNNSK